VGPDFSFDDGVTSFPPARGICHTLTVFFLFSFTRLKRSIIQVLRSSLLSPITKDAVPRQSRIRPRRYTFSFQVGLIRLSLSRVALSGGFSFLSYDRHRYSKVEAV